MKNLLIAFLVGLLCVVDVRADYTGITPADLREAAAIAGFCANPNRNAWETSPRAACEWAHEARLYGGQD